MNEVKCLHGWASFVGLSSVQPERRVEEEAVQLRGKYSIWPLGLYLIFPNSFSRVMFMGCTRRLFNLV